MYKYFSLIKLLRVARPQFLIAGLVLFLLGALWAVLLGAVFSPLRFLLGYLVVLACQLSVHFSNDYFDVDSDRPGGVTLISGGAGVLLEHPELREPARRIAVGLILFSLSMGAVLIQMYSYPFSMMGFVALGNLLGWCYSAPPWRLSYRGLGELCYAFVGGFLVPSMGYMVMRGKLDLYGIFFLVPLTFYGLVSLLSVEIPDFEDDRLANKRNWVVRGGRNFGFTMAGLLLLAATAYFFVSPHFYQQHIPADLRVFGLFSLLPLAAGILGMAKRPRERQPATKIAIGIIAALVVFGLFVNSYLFYLILIN